MAIQEQLNVLQQGAEVWNTWRTIQLTMLIGFFRADLSEADLRGANLRGANLRRADLFKTNLRGANLSEADLKVATLYKADLSEANLSEANLTEADLKVAKLSGARLRRADLTEADLRGANLTEADLRGADLRGADLRGANLTEADLRGADLRGADLNKTIMGRSIFGDLDLRMVKGLETIQHHGPSTIGTDTLERSEGDIPDVFLREAGLSENFITYAHSLLQSPIQYYTCFISYSSKDQKFAERLYTNLRQKGIKCWFAPEDLKIGEEFPDRIEEAIRFYDKLLIILSQDSIDSSWVKKEVRAAQEKEEHLKKKHSNQTVLFPIKIDSSIEQCQLQWVAELRRERHIGDFTSYKFPTFYEKAFQRLLRDLQPNQQKSKNNE